MSAIVGLYFFKNEPVLTEQLTQMSTSLAAHGPDRSGTWQQEAVGLAQRQMVITPEDQYEYQPLLRMDGQLALVSDARLDNRSELADKLRIDPAEVATLPDSALILAAYERWAEEAPKHLLGDYAFAVWDGRRQLLFLARGPLSNRPLYYYQSASAFAFATMPSGLFALPWVPRTLALENWWEFDPHRRVLFRDLKKVPMGHWVRVSKAGVETRCFWQLDLERRLRFQRDEEYVEAFDELFTRAVQCRLRSLYPIGISMSGGLDSSSVAVTAARLLAEQGESLTAYTAVPRPGFDGPVPPSKYSDETPFVQAIAEMVRNLQLQLVRTEERSLFTDLDQFFAAMYGPFQNVSNRPWIEAIQAKAQAQKVRVLLTGASGNLTVSWSGSNALPALLHQRAWGQAWCVARQQAGSPLKAGRSLLGQGVLPLFPSRLQAAIRHLRKGDLRPLFTTQPLPTAMHPQLIQAKHRKGWASYQFPTAGAQRQLRYDSLLHGIEQDYAAASAARFGLSWRDPTSDQRLVEFCFAVPEEQWQRGGVRRSLIRRAMTGRLPATVLHNPQSGLQAADWYEELFAQRATIQSDLARLVQSATARHYLDLPSMHRLVDNLPQTGWENLDQFVAYHWGLLEGLMMGHFILWYEANILHETAQELVP